jgi:hypothetical protein
MQLHPSEFFPDQATWPFFEYSTREEVAIAVKSRGAGDQRVVEFSAPLEHRFRAFFDRMTVTPGGLELNRVRMFIQTLDIRPPLVITTGDQRDHVADLLPNIEGLLGPTTKPYDGTAVFKHLKEIPRPGFPNPDLLWSIGIESRGQDRAIVFRTLLQFLRSAGLIEYTGDVYGSFFVYRRTDLPDYFPPTPPPAPPPQPGAAPHLPKPHPTKPENPLPPEKIRGEYHARVAKEVWDSIYEPARLTSLKERGKEEREVAVLLVRHDLVKPEDSLTKVLRQQAKTDRELAENLRRHHLLNDE